MSADSTIGIAWYSHSTGRSVFGNVLNVAQYHPEALDALIKDDITRAVQ
jgi:delta 1-pyrroline-5-carboxylate dehydrogenase